MLLHSTTAMRLTALHTESNTGCFTPLLHRDYWKFVYRRLASSEVVIHAFESIMTSYGIQFIHIYHL